MGGVCPAPLAVAVRSGAAPLVLVREGTNLQTKAVATAIVASVDNI
jgi:hypothetical protein